MPKQNKQPEWFLIEKIPKSFIFLLAGWARNISRNFEKEFGGNIQAGLFFRDGALSLFFKDNEWKRAGKSIFTKTLKNPEFLNKFNLKNKAIQKKEFEFCKKLQKTNLKSLDDKKLGELFFQLSESHAQSISIGWVDMAMEFRNEFFSSYLTRYLSQKAKARGLKQSGAEIFSLLSTPSRTTIGKEEENALLKIVETILKDKKTKELFAKNSVKNIDAKLAKINSKISNALDAHVVNYGWIFHMYIGPAWDRVKFINRIKEEIVKKDITNIIRKSKTEQEEIIAEKKKLLRKLKIDKKHLKLLGLASELVFNKDLRKHAIYFTCYSSQGIFEELGKRLNMKTEEVKNVIPWEFFELLAKGKERKIKEEAQKNKNLLMIFKNGVCQKIYGRDADLFLKNNVIEENETKVDFLKGSCAFPGKLKGIVKLVNEVEDMPKLKEGEILVAHQTNPDIIMAMKRASGFITDLGGITCHAAIVAREMRKPCVVGIINATKVLKDGQLVEVDANAGVVRII